MIYLWGVKGEDLHVSLRDNLTPDRFGKADFLPINISTPDAQNFLVEACQLMKDSNELIQSPSSSSCVCPITIFQEFAMTSLGHFSVSQDEFKNKDFQAGFRNYLNLRLGFGEAEKSTGKVDCITEFMLVPSIYSLIL